MDKKDIQKMFFRLEKNLGLVRQDYLDSWGGSQITNFLLALQQVCELMQNDYEEENEEV